MSACGNPVEFLVDAIEVEVVRIERAAVPIELVVVIGMAGIGDRFEEAIEPGDAADVFGWAVHGTIYEAWVAHPRIGAELIFDLDAMLRIPPAKATRKVTLSLLG